MKGTPFTGEIPRFITKAIKVKNIYFLDRENKKLNKLEKIKMLLKNVFFFPDNPRDVLRLFDILQNLSKIVMYKITLERALKLYEN